MKVIETKQGYKVIKANSEDFKLIGCGFLEKGNHVLVCDDSNVEIPNGEECYYIPVLNRILCKKEFDRWEGNAKYYPEDIVYEERYLKMYTDLFNKIEL